MVYDWVVHIRKRYYGFTCNQLDCKLIWQSANGPKGKLNLKEIDRFVNVKFKTLFRYVSVFSDPLGMFRIFRLFQDHKSQKLQ